jgi:hypothetical protein
MEPGRPRPARIGSNYSGGKPVNDTNKHYENDKH